MSLWQRLSALGAAGLFIITASAQDVQKIFPFKGGVKIDPGVKIAIKDLAIAPEQGKFFTQSWTYVYYTDDGGGGYIQFTVMRLGYTLKQIGAHHTHYTADGKMVYRKEILSAKDLKWDAKAPRLRMGRSEWYGFYPDFHVVVPLEGLETDLSFECLVPPWRPGQGPVHYVEPDGDWYDLVVFIPLARVTGKIRVDGVDHKITGWGYADHNTQTVWFNTQVKNLYALRSFNQNWAIHFLDYHSPQQFGGARVSWLLVMKDDKIIHATSDFAVTPSDWAREPRRNREYPRQVKVAVNDPGFQLEAEIKGIKLLDVLDVRDQVPSWLEPTVSRLIRQPAFIRQKAEMTWKVRYQGKEELVPARGIFEYTIVEKE